MELDVWTTEPYSDLLMNGSNFEISPSYLSMSTSTSNPGVSLRVS